jgi:hypothetical protein
MDGAVVVGEVERDVVVDLHDQERPERRRRGDAEQLGQEGGRLPLVADADDRVVELDGHRRSLLGWEAGGDEQHGRKARDMTAGACRPAPFDHRCRRQEREDLRACLAEVFAGEVGWPSSRW